MMVVLMAAAVATGCQSVTRMSTKVSEVPRVDQAMELGNRGYIIGTPPEGSELKTTRQMIDTTIEIPSFYTPGSKLTAAGGIAELLQGDGASGPQHAAQPAQQEAAAPDEAIETAPAQPEQFDSYVVQKGESLWSIAAKPDVYGKATQWRRIFDANRDLLKSPDHLKAGMTLKIPRSGDAEPGTVYGDEGVTSGK
jgi:nucleoid-associated protein YgaU